MHNPDIIILIKIKVNSTRARQMIHSMNLSNHVKITLEGLSRGLWLLWVDNATFQFEILHPNNRLITVEYKINSKIFPD